MTASLRLEIQALLSRMCDGEISDAEHLRLEELLAGDAECRYVYLEYIDLHSQLILKSHLRAILPASTQRDEFCGAAGATLSAKALPAARTDAEATPPTSRAATIYRYCLVACATLTATILVQVFWWRPATPQTPTPNRTFATPAKVDDSKFVATLRDAVDCVWEPPDQPMQVGARLLQGELRVPKGVFNIHFDSGPELVIEGPALLRLESSTAATVLFGKVVLRADESAAPFDLHTPTAVLAESGTEVAVTVSIEGEEVHVFEGEVQRKSTTLKGAAPEQLKAGEAWRYGPMASTPGKKMKCDPTRFIRHVAPPKGPLDPGAGLIAYEGFDYRTAMMMTSPKGLMSKGWIGPWKPGFTRPAVDSDRPRFPFHTRGLTRADAAVPTLGGSFDYTGFTQYFRRLARPIRLDADRTYYLSYLFHRHATAIDPINSVGIQFWTNENYQTQKFEDARQRLYIGVKKANQVTARFQRMEAQTPLALKNGSTYLLVAKISATRSGPNQVFVRVYGPADNVDASEPTKWSLTTSPFSGDLVFDWMQLHINSKTRQTIDEIRIGTSWSSVTTAYLVRPQP